MHPFHTRQQLITYFNGEISTLATHIAKYPNDAVSAKRMITLIERVDRIERGAKVR